MKQVTMLAMSEPAQLDAEKLEQLYEELGDSAAEDVVCRAMEELAVKLAQTDRLYRSGQIAEMRKTVRSMGAIAGQIGMGTLARVAGDVLACVDANDGTALAACASAADADGRELTHPNLAVTGSFDLRHKNVVRSSL